MVWARSSLSLLSKPFGIGAIGEEIMRLENTGCSDKREIRSSEGLSGEIPSKSLTRTLVNSLTSLMVGSVFVLGVGCGKQNSKAPTSGIDPNAPVVNIDPNGYVPKGTGPGEGPGVNWEFGGTAELTVTDLSSLSAYTARPMNDPQDLKVNLNFKKVKSRDANNSFGGTVSISYKDNGYTHQGSFTSGTSTESNKYNLWFRSASGPVYHGFFEDYLGGLIVVIDEVLDLGDGEVQDKASGSLWFKNFEVSKAPNPLYGSLPGFGRPQTFCWFISIGPYDCRGWIRDNKVQTRLTTAPGNGYKKLGEFEGMPLSEAFNHELHIN